jgi:zinc protease
MKKLAHLGLILLVLRLGHVVVRKVVGGESLPHASSVALDSANTRSGAKSSTAAKTPEKKFLSDAVKTTATAKPWPHESSDLKVDPKVVWGKLDNGLRYAILPTDAPGNAALQLHMNVGSFMEADDQRGMAHFLEHMAFNGTKHFAPGEMSGFLQRLGLSALADMNAGTSIDRTVYQLALPRTNKEMTSEALTWFRDVLDGMSLDANQIERERRVICAELLARNSAGLRSAVPLMRFSLPETLLPRRVLVGGTVETVRALPRPRFVDFYETWYTPARATIVATGKFDVPMVERLIREMFSDAKARRGEQPDPPLGKVTVGRGTIAGLHSDPDADRVSISLNVERPASNLPDSVARIQASSPLDIANAMLSKRLVKFVSAKDSPIQAAGANNERLFNLAEECGVTAQCQPGKWRAALGALEQELRRAIKYGFTDAEFDEIKRETIQAFQALADGADDRPPASLAAGIVDDLAKNEVFSHPAYNLTLTKSLVGAIKKTDCEQALRAAWNSPDVLIWIDGNLSLEGDSSRQILAAYHASQTVAVQPPAEEKTGKWAYTNFGPAGRIVKREVLKDLDFVEAVFDNNVHVNVKRTKFEKNLVNVRVRFGGGKLESPADKPGLPIFASSVFIDGGLEAHSIDEIGHILAGKEAGVNFSVDDDAFQLDGRCSPDLLELQLQDCAAELIAPGYRPEPVQGFLSRLESNYARFEHTAEGKVLTDVIPFVRSNDPRFAMPPREAMRKLTMDDLKAWLSEPLRSGYIEVAIVGDVDPDAALTLTAKTLGALPKRAAVKPSFATAREVRFPAAPKSKEFRFVAETPRAMNLVFWPTEGARNPSASLRTVILTDVLSERLFNKVRQELGATYTPTVTSCSPSVFPDYGYIQAELTVEPKQAAEIGPLVAKIAAELAAGSISDDEFQRAINPYLSSLADLDKGNVYWIGLLCHCQEDPEFLDRARHLKAEVASITKPEIEALARKYLAAGQATVISVVPAPNGSEVAKSPGKNAAATAN